MSFSGDRQEGRPWSRAPPSDCTARSTGPAEPSGTGCVGYPCWNTNASLDIKTRFVRGMEITVDPRSIRITGVEELPNRSFIVYLAVPDAGTIRQAAVFGQCVDPGDLGYGGGFIEGPNDPELEGQRAAAESTACP